MRSGLLPSFWYEYWIRAAPSVDHHLRVRYLCQTTIITILENMSLWSTLLNVPFSPFSMGFKTV